MRRFIFFSVVSGGILPAFAITLQAAVACGLSGRGMIQCMLNKACHMTRNNGRMPAIDGRKNL
ncbi:hypothetical protein [Sediminicoccus sp. BL-A-41-H5]|uniref:hypothetical protein n=1 Tax=Sediminicoccus sp. BL-A-41-H5 TaxID=3421106 RepID=UPI003D66B6F2